MNPMDKMRELAKLTDMEKVDFPSTWKLSEKGIQAIQHGVAMHKTKHGMYASIPMICKAEDCQYAEVCPLVEMSAAPKGERCPLEISLILTSFEDYKTSLGVDPDNIVDMGLVKDLIDCDVQVMRAENKMAVDGDFIEEAVIGIDDETGDPIIQKRISQASDYKERIIAKKHKILNLLNSTRKDKAGQKISVTMDPSSYAATIMEKVKEAPIGEFVDFDDIVVLDMPEDDPSKIYSSVGKEGTFVVDKKLFPDYVDPEEEVVEESE